MPSRASGEWTMSLQGLRRTIQCRDRQRLCGERALGSTQLLNLGQIGRSVIAQCQLERSDLVSPEKRVSTDDRFVNLARALREPVLSGVGLDKGICVVKVEREREVVRVD